MDEHRHNQAALAARPASRPAALAGSVARKPSTVGVGSEQEARHSLVALRSHAFLFPLGLFCDVYRHTFAGGYASTSAEADRLEPKTVQ